MAGLRGRWSGFKSNDDFKQIKGGIKMSDSTKMAAEELGRLTFSLQTDLQKAENRIRALREPKQFKVITLCGSTKFKNEFEEINARLTMEGSVVISVGVFGHANNVQFSEGEKEQLDKIHLQKIDMADEIFVINPGGYIGSSTKNEINYAKLQGIPVRYLESV